MMMMMMMTMRIGWRVGRIARFSLLAGAVGKDLLGGRGWSKVS